VDRVAIALGSNLGDRRAHLDHAVAALHHLLSNLTVSNYYDTVPVGVVGPHPVYLNAAAVGDTLLPPRALLDALLGIEGTRGRVRPYPNAPRTLDLDLLDYQGQVMTGPALTLPHPRMAARSFVLVPLRDVAPHWRHPVTGQGLPELLAGLPDRDAPKPLPG